MNKLLLVLFLGLMVIPISAQEKEPELRAAHLLDEASALTEDEAFQQAIVKLDLFIEFNPDYPDAYIQRASVYLSLEDEEAALTDIQSAIDVTVEDDPEVAAAIHLMRADVYISMEEADLALLDYDRAIELHPENAFAFLKRAILHGRLEDYDAAIADYTRVLALEPDNTNLYFSRANIYLLMEDPEAALEDMDTAIELNPENAEQYIERAKVHEQLENMAEAASDYSQWLEYIEENSFPQDAVTATNTYSLEMSLGSVYRIPIEGFAEQSLGIVANSRSVDSLIVLLDPEGNPLIADDDGGIGLNALIGGYKLPEDGVYTLLAGHARGGWRGTITLTIELSASRRL